VKGQGGYPTGNLPKCTQRTDQGRCWQGRSIEQSGVEAVIHNTGRWVVTETKPVAAIESWRARRRLRNVVEGKKCLYLHGIICFSK
jgi:hypothetical protein